MNLYKAGLSPPFLFLLLLECFFVEFVRLIAVTRGPLPLAFDIYRFAESKSSLPCRGSAYFSGRNYHEGYVAA